MSSMMIQVTEETKEQIERLARTTGNSKETILGEVVETGLKNYHTTPTKGIQALLDLAAWAEKHHITGPKDLSTNHNKYAWEDFC